METRKLELHEQLSSIEKMLMVAGAIPRVAYGAERVLRIRRDMAVNKPDSEWFSNSVKDTEDLLKDMSVELYNIYERMCDFLNDCDYVSNVDIALSRPIYNAFHDSVDTQDDEEPFNDLVDNKDGN